MAILPVTDTSVAVNTFGDLRTVLTNAIPRPYTNIDTVYLYGDITFTDAGGIDIYTGWNSITLDGRNPFLSTETDDVIHTVTDRDSVGTGTAIGIHTATTITVTFQNLNWKGRNYFGLCYVPNDSAYRNVTLRFMNVNYEGCQMIYHRWGLSQIIDCTINITKLGTAANAQEVGEVCQIEIGGYTSILHTWSGINDSVFWFIGTTLPPYFKILPNAIVNISTMMDFIYTDAGHIPITIGEKASFALTTASGVFRLTSHRAASVTVEKNATIKIIQTQARGTYSTFYCDGEFLVKEGADVYMQANYANAAPLIYFYSANAKLTLQNPKRFALYSSSGLSFQFDATVTAANPADITIYAQQINYWTAPAAFAIAGSFEDIPTYSWRKKDGVTTAYMIGTARSAGTSITQHNFTAEELVGKPLSAFQLHTVRVFSVGNLPIVPDAITDDGYPVTGSTLPESKVRVKHDGNTFNGTADGNGQFSIDTGIIPKEDEVEIGANYPFLITWIKRQSIDAGELYIKDVPDIMRFILTVIATTPVTLYGRDLAAWQLTVMDTRVHSSDWYLYAIIHAPLTSVVNPAHTVPGALVYVGGDDSVTELSETPVLVYIGSNSGGTPTETPVSWDTVKGILLQATTYPFYNGEEYRAPIEWILSETEIDTEQPQLQ